MTLKTHLMKATSVVSNTLLPLKYCHDGLSDSEAEQKPDLYWHIDKKLIGSRIFFCIGKEYNIICFVGVFFRKKILP